MSGWDIMSKSYEYHSGYPRFDETAAVPLSSPVVADTRPQFDIRRGDHSGGGPRRG